MPQTPTQGGSGNPRNQQIRMFVAPGGPQGIPRGWPGLRGPAPGDPPGAARGGARFTPKVNTLVFAGAPAGRGGCRRHSRQCRRHSTASRREWRLHPASAPTPGQHPGLGRTRTPGCYPGGGAGRRRVVRTNPCVTPWAGSDQPRGWRGLDPGRRPWAYGMLSTSDKGQHSGCAGQSKRIMFPNTIVHYC